MNETPMTVVGNVVDDPGCGGRRAGTAVANFRVASTTRRFDREKGAWIGRVDPVRERVGVARDGREHRAVAAQGAAGDGHRAVLPARVHGRRAAAHVLRARGDRGRPRPDPGRRDVRARSSRPPSAAVELDARRASRRTRASTSTTSADARHGRCRGRPGHRARCASWRRPAEPPRAPPRVAAAGTLDGAARAPAARPDRTARSAQWTGDSATEDG